MLVLSPSGRVIADSAVPGEVGTSYASRPEVKAALKGQDYQQTRNSQTLGTPILATAVPITKGGSPAGAVRITQSVSAVTSAVRTAILGLVILGAVVLALALVAGALIAQQISRPIRRLDRVARRVAAGELEAQAPLEGSTEQRSLAVSFNDMTARMRRLLHSQQDFVADASHQLRTPLTGLRLQLEELRETAAPGDPSVARLDAALAEVDRLSEMVNELLILSRAGEHELPAQRVELAPAVDALVKRWHKAAADAEVQLLRHSEAAAEPVWCAPADLDRALDALVENAIRYSPPGGSVDIVIGLGARGGSRPRTRSRSRRGGGRLRALLPWQGGTERPARHWARAADRSGAGGAMGRFGDAHEPPGRGRPRRRGVRPGRGDGGQWLPWRAMTSLGSIRWILLALLGLAVAAGVSVAASQLVSQRIGLAAEPVSAGKDLAPPKHDSGRRRGGCQSPHVDRHDHRALHDHDHDHALDRAIVNADDDHATTAAVLKLAVNGPSGRRDTARAA